MKGDTDYRITPAAGCPFQARGVFAFQNSPELQSVQSPRAVKLECEVETDWGPAGDDWRGWRGRAPVGGQTGRRQQGGGGGRWSWMMMGW